MPPKVAMAFDPEGLMIPISEILPMRKLPASIRATEKYHCIAASVKEVGIIEPLVVFPQGAHYLLLDGAIRLDILKSAGETEVFCLKATDDEAFTYNHKVSRLSPIQEHFMIMRAIEHGVSEDRIAATLSVDVHAIRQKRNMLNGICPEAVALLKDKRIASAALREVRRVAPLRQVEMAELMTAANNFSCSYARCLCAATPEEQRVEPLCTERDLGVSADDAAMMQRELRSLGQEFKVLEETHGENVLHLVLAVGYVKCLLANNRVSRFFAQHEPGMLAELQKIVEAPDLDASGQG